MMPNAGEITTPYNLHSTLIKETKKNYIFRGVSDAAKHELIPSIGRYRGVAKHERKEFERVLLNDFKLQGISFCESEPRSEWEWIAIAQHHGLPTRLLDWTTNPLVATFFAVESESNADGALYMIEIDQTVELEPEYGPFSIHSIMKFEPFHVDRRFSAQSGLFTIHPEPFEVMDDSLVQNWKIPANRKRALREHLESYHINRASLFPGLDGIALNLKKRNQCYIDT